MEQLFNKDDKNLLAFSAGIDSTALFYILKDNKIEFDIAIVDYGVRDQSKNEVSYAISLAQKYNKKIYIRQYDDIKFNEKLARDFRYKFFKELIEEYGYNNLITAHQLNDRLEWLLMQLTRGAGLNELISFTNIEKRDGYNLIRPLLDKSKKELEEYLDDREITYFIDDTNTDTKFKRNYFRLEFANKLIEEFGAGIINSFDYMQNDMDSLNKLSKQIYKNKSLSVYSFNGDKNIAIKVIDKELKQRGILISKATRDEILAQNEIVISGKVAISIVQYRIWLSPASKIGMMKDFKEVCRKNKIPKNIRAYLSTLFKNHEEMVKSLHEKLAI